MLYYRFFFIGKEVIIIANKVHGRGTVYNPLVTDELLAQVNPENKSLMEDFLDYMKSIDRSPQTISSYRSDLLIFFTWVLLNLNNKRFVDITKREFSRFQSHALETWKWSPKRVRRVKSAISSMSDFIENILDEEPEYQNYSKVINKIESPPNAAVREKTILSDEEVQLILDTLLERGKLQACCIVAVLAYSGMRKAELLQMRPEYFDEDHIIFDALHQTDLIRAKGRGKNGHQMHKWILMQGDKYIMPWIEKRKENGIECEWLFCTRDGDSWRKLESIDHIMDYISEIVNKPVYAHSFRHFVCTRMLTEYNLPSEVVREFFQWESVEMTKVYCDRNTMDDFGKYFSADGIVKQEEKSLSDLK